jgi:hypothetical protein
MHINNSSAFAQYSVPSGSQPAQAASALSAIRKGTHRFVRLVTLVTLCLSALVRADEQVPFKGYFNPVVVSTTPIDETHVLLDFDVYIVATQLGKAQGPASAILDLTTFTYVGEATWAAANGDAISITFAGQFVPTDTAGLFDNVETIEVVGGTGRFEGATGSCAAGGQFDFITASVPAPIPFTGTISSPGSLRK